MVLDGPLIQSLNVLFFEDSETPEQKITRQTGESLGRMGFARTPKQEAIIPPRRAVSLFLQRNLPGTESDGRQDDRDPYDGTLLRYINPATGGYTYPTMSCEIQLFNAKEVTKAHRHTSTALYHALKGRDARKSVKDIWNGKRVTLSSCRSGNGTAMKILAMTKRFFFPSMTGR